MGSKDQVTIALESLQKSAVKTLIEAEHSFNGSDSSFLHDYPFRRTDPDSSTNEDGNLLVNGMVTDGSIRIIGCTAAETITVVGRRDPSGMQVEEVKLIPQVGEVILVDFKNPETQIQAQTPQANDPTDSYEYLQGRIVQVYPFVELLEEAVRHNGDNISYA